MTHNGSQTVPWQLIASALSHEVGHGAYQPQLLVLANTLATQLNLDLGDVFGALTSEPLPSLGISTSLTTKDANGNSVTVNIWPIASPSIAEAIGYVNGCISAIQATLKAGKPVDQAQCVVPDGQAGWKDMKQYLDWFASITGLDPSLLEKGAYTPAQINAAVATLATSHKDKLAAALAGKQKEALPHTPPKWVEAQNYAVTADAFVQFVTDIEKGGLNNDLSAFANALEVAGMLPTDLDPKISDANALTRDSSYVAMLNTILSYFQTHGAAQGFAAAASVASAAANAFDKNAQSIPGGAASYLKTASAVLSDLSLIASSKGAGSLQRDLQYVQAADSTVNALLNFYANGANPKVAAALGEVAGGVADVLAIIQAFQQGGVLGGIQAGFSTNALIDIIAENIQGLAPLGNFAVPIAVAIGLAALFFGGNHDRPETMPDKYDEPTYGQGVANLQGHMGATPLNQPYTTYTENPGLVQLFSGRTGIQAVEETLAMYQTKDNAPNWLKPQFDQLESMFGESANGAGKLSIGDGGSGKDCNNQDIVGVSGVDGKVYQYTQLDAALSQFQTAYAKAVAGGQAMPMTWRSATDPGSPPPGDEYTSQSYYA